MVGPLLATFWLGYSIWGFSTLQENVSLLFSKARMLGLELYLRLFRVDFDPIEFKQGG